MGDRKTSSNSSHLKFIPADVYRNTSTTSNLFSIQQDYIALEIMIKGWIHSQLRDELFLQLIKQTTNNESSESLLFGWQLIAISLNFFPPSHRLVPFMRDYIESHHNFDNQNQIGDIARASSKRLKRINITGAKKGLKKPTLEEVILSKNTITSPSLFGVTLDEIMRVQKVKCPQLTLPWIQTTLSEAILKLNGSKTEGIFRVPGDLDEVNNLKVKYDQLWCADNLPLSSSSLNSDGDDSIDSLFSQLHDPHLPASLLKLWFRELHEPLIPPEYYDACVDNCENVDECIKIIESLPEINKLVFTYLIRFLKVFAAPINVAITKMDASNLSMIMAPNCLRCKSNDPKTIIENTKKEMKFIKTLIQSLDTTSVQGII
jgi:Rho GTPase-activating protein 39